MRGKVIMAYQMSEVSNSELPMPEGARLLGVERGHAGGWFVWALVDNSMPTERRRLFVSGCGTHHDEITETMGAYLGEIVDGCVHHVFEMPPEADADERVTAHEPKPGDALEVIERFGGIDGAHHKQWVLDQVVRALTGPGYAKWVEFYQDGEDGPGTYLWDKGIAP